MQSSQAIDVASPATLSVLLLAARDNTSLQHADADHGDVVVDGAVAIARLVHSVASDTLF